MVEADFKQKGGIDGSAVYGRWKKVTSIRFVMNALSLQAAEPVMLLEEKEKSQSRKCKQKAVTSEINDDSDRNQALNAFFPPVYFVPL